MHTTLRVKPIARRYEWAWCSNVVSRDIRLYNTMTQRIEPLGCIEPGRVGVYVCGLTTYDHAHAGHARTFVTFDVLVRFLRACGLRVTFVRNITDVDDKILKGAVEAGEPPMEFSARMARINTEELRAIGCVDPDLEPRVSENVAEIIDLVQKLVAQGAAYVAPTRKGDDVYFAVRSFGGYGKLSHRNIDELLAGARVEPGEAKRDALDFALWKSSGPGEWGWESPWGNGRPGWHIECSAMAAKALSPHFDIHGGGMDLIFPHHENEIAQSEAAWGGPFARMWLHAGFLRVDSEKMSKSLGNFVTIAQILERNDAEALRYFLLGAHYRGPIDFDLEKIADGRVIFPGLDEAERRIDYLYATREALIAMAAGEHPAVADEGQHAKIVREAPERVLASLGADLNTAVALSILSEVARIGNEHVRRAPSGRRAAGEARSFAAAIAGAIDACCLPMGLLQAPAAAFFERTRMRRLRLRGLRAERIEERVMERVEARRAKDFARADAIRDELASLGIELRDVPGGGPTTWRVQV
jgi:cysteinyl-tRNA synthetase